MTDDRLCPVCGDVYEAGKITKRCCQKTADRVKAALGGGRKAYRKQGRKIRRVTVAGPGICIMCGAEFKRRGIKKTCSDPCSKERKRQMMQKYAKEHKDYLKAYQAWYSRKFRRKTCGV